MKLILTAEVEHLGSPGDTVEVEIPGIGILSNPVAAEFDASAL